ncbi:PQQ-binding-like beta-propeller repeat protein [Dysgonomonas sp. ZJ709]|uniref:outer membrane protein assembly factor BamB family protein n=1 Tax=Dysgonomonas sp. ZJ709 TaxID=2709797 RepID=UPI0013EC1724|nr:PQQ-binding-like beta-propeller repeat protein [Dysgonomonas sp. ZJ709]
MKKIVYAVIITVLTLLCACENDLPKANFDMKELSELNATATDMEVSLSWKPMEGTTPTGYYISWESGSATVSGGEKNVGSDLQNVLIDGLTNGISYKFSVQPVYADQGRGGKISAIAKPTSTRIAATNFIAAAGDKKVRLKWTKPDSENLTGYKLLASPGTEPVTISKDVTSYEVTDLTNDTEYSFSLVCVYAHGLSDVVEAKATPGIVLPVIVANTTLTLNETCTFNYNEMYFVMGTVQSVKWDFGDGNTSNENQPQHSFSASGSYTVKVTVTYTDGTSESGTIVMTVSGYGWSVTEIKFGEFSGYVKVSNVVFSPDGKTAYIPTSTPNGHLFAIDVAGGNVKWASRIATVTYAGGALVDANGIIYQCGTDKKVYAINPTDGSKKWTCDVDGVIGAFPALGDGVIYCATNSGTVYAINTASGSVSWSKSVDGTGSAVAADASGNVYVGTSSAVYKFNTTGTQQWKTGSALNVTERGAFAINGTTLYATLKSGAGLTAIDMNSGTIKWTYANAGGSDAYFPIIGTDGTIYFNEKGGTYKKVYAINANGSLKWDKDLGAAMTYCGLVLADNGMIYCATQAKTGNVYKVYGLNTMNGNIGFTYDSEQQIMAGATIGNDKRLYIGTIGANNIGSLMAIPIEAGPQTSSWSVRGGNIYGTNRK